MMQIKVVLSCLESQVVYTRNVEVAAQNVTKIALSCAIKFAYVNGPLDYYGLK